MAWSSRPYACLPQGNWNWPSGIIWCNGYLWLGLVDIYWWGSNYTYDPWWGQIDAYNQDQALQVFKVRPEGMKKVVGGHFNAPILKGPGVEDHPDGYGPFTWLGEQPDSLGMAADNRYIYIGNDYLQQVKRFDTETYMVETLIGPTSGYETRDWPADGLASSAVIGIIGQMRYVADRDALFFWDCDDFGVRTLLRKCTLGADPTVTTIYDAADHPQWNEGWSTSWLGTLNPSTGLRHKLDSDVIFAMPHGLVYHEGYLYWGEYDYPFAGVFQGALRRMPIDGGSIELLMYADWDNLVTDIDPVDHAGVSYKDRLVGAVGSVEVTGTRYVYGSQVRDDWFYGKAHHPDRHPINIWHPFPFTDMHDMQLVGNTLFMIWWDHGFQDGGIGDNQRMVYMDLNFLLDNAPLRADRIDPPWQYLKPYPSQPHNKWWHQTLYWREGAEPYWWYIPYKGLESQDGKLYYLHHLIGTDEINNWYEAHAMISVLEPTGPGSGGDVGFRVKFEGPALQAYASKVPTTMTKELGVFELS